MAVDLKAEQNNVDTYTLELIAVIGNEGTHAKICNAITDFFEVEAHNEIKGVTEDTLWYALCNHYRLSEHPTHEYRIIRITENGKRKYDKIAYVDRDDTRQRALKLVSNPPSNVQWQSTHASRQYGIIEYVDTGNLLIHISKSE